MVNIVWDFSILKHEDKDATADLMLEVSKLINKVGSTASPFTIIVQATCTNAEVIKLVTGSNKSLKNHPMKTIYINKLTPA